MSGELYKKKGLGPREDLNNDNKDDQMAGHPSLNHNKKIMKDGFKNNSQEFHQFRNNKVLKYSGSKSTPVLKKVLKMDKVLKEKPSLNSTTSDSTERPSSNNTEIIAEKTYDPGNASERDFKSENGKIYQKNNPANKKNALIQGLKNLTRS